MDYYKHADHLVDIFLDSLQKNALHFFGDSHSQTFSELNRVCVHHIGPVTAFNLVRSDSSTRGREKLLKGVKELDPNECAIGLSFGEIDCRAHIVKKAIMEQLSIESLVRNTIENYCSVIREIKQLGYEVVVLGLAGSGRGMNLNFPKVGRERERNRSMVLFNDFMRRQSVCDNFLFVDIQDVIIDFPGLSSRHAFLLDGCHLNKFPRTSKDIQCIILSRLIQKTTRQAALSFKDGNSFHRINHAEGSSFTLSSSWGSFPQNGVVAQSDKFFFHTSQGPGEHIEIYFEEGCIIDEIVIHNRIDGHFSRANSLEAELFLIGKQANDIARIEIPTNEEFLSGKENRTHVRFSPLLCHKVRITSRALTYLHFSNIELNGWYPGSN